MSSDGLTSERPAAVTLVVAPPFWQRAWFRIGALALLLGGAALAYRYRVRRILEVERVRTRIATDLHDDIGSDLSQIAILAEVVRRDAGSSNPTVEERLQSIAATASRLVDSMSDIVWAVSPSRDSMEDLVQRMRRFASDSLAARNIAFRFRAPAEGDLRLGPDVRRAMLLVLKESVNNVVKHSQCRSVDIHLRREGRKLALTVEDDGVGFDPGLVTGGTGLSSMRQRLESLGGTLEIESRRGGGTSITLRV